MYHRLGEAIREGCEAYPNFDLAVKRHRLLDAMQRSSDRGGTRAGSVKVVGRGVMDCAVAVHKVSG